MLQGWLEGSPGGDPTHADVRDVARAHILAAENPSASGHRYIVSQRQSSNPAEVGRWLQVGAILCSAFRRSSPGGLS